MSVFCPMLSRRWPWHCADTTHWGIPATLFPSSILVHNLCSPYSKGGSPGDVSEEPPMELILVAELILQPFRHFTYVTVHSPTLFSLILRHKLFIYVTWRAAHAVGGAKTVDQNTRRKQNGGCPLMCGVSTMSGPPSRQHRTEHRQRTHTSSPRIQFKMSDPVENWTLAPGFEGRDYTHFARATDRLTILILNLFLCKWVQVPSHC